MKRLAVALLLPIALGTAIVLLALLASAPNAALADDPPRIEVDKSAESELCETASIHLQVRGEGTAIEERVPVDVMLVLDRSGSMDNAHECYPFDPPECEEQPITDAKNAAKALVDQLEPELDQVGLVSYATTASSPIDHILTSGVSGFNDVKAAIDAQDAFGYTNIGDAVWAAQEELESGRHNPDAVPVMVVLTDGIACRSHAGDVCETWPASATVCTNDAINQAATAKANGTIVFTVGLNLVWGDYSPAVGNLARSVLTQMASEPGYYFETTDHTELEGIFEQVANILILIAGKDVVVTEILPPNLHYVSGSAVLAPDSVVGQTLTWLLPIVSIGDIYDFYLDVTVDPPAGLVLADVYPDSRVDYDDYQGNPQSLPFPETFVYVEACSPSPVGGIVELSSGTSAPSAHQSDTAAFPYMALAGAAAAALLALTAGAWYARRRWVR
jgi:hypothetical protein